MLHQARRHVGQSGRGARRVAHASGGLDALAGDGATPALLGEQPTVLVKFGGRPWSSTTATERDYHGQLAAFARAHRHRDVHLSVNSLAG